MGKMAMFSLLWIVVLCSVLSCNEPENSVYSCPEASFCNPSVHSPASGENHLTQTGAIAMPSDVFAGALPNGAENWEFDQDPLPPKALVKFQSLSRSPDVSRNYRWLLYSDGRLFLARHSGNVADTPAVFDTDLPQTPGKTLSPSAVKNIEKKLRSANFLNQMPYQTRLSVQDGSWYVVTARIDGRVHQVIYDAYAPSLVTFLESIE